MLTKTNKSKKDLLKTIGFVKIIGEENRLKIINFLKKEEKCVCDIWKHLNLSQNLTSHHLKKLKDFKLISSRQEGLRVIYSINKKNIKNYTKLLNNYLNSYD